MPPHAAGCRPLVWHRSIWPRHAVARHLFGAHGAGDRRRRGVLRAYYGYSDRCLFRAVSAARSCLDADGRRADGVSFAAARARAHCCPGAERSQFDHRHRRRIYDDHHPHHLRPDAAPARGNLRRGVPQHGLRHDLADRQTYPAKSDLAASRAGELRVCVRSARGRVARLSRAWRAAGHSELGQHAGQIANLHHARAMAADLSGHDDCVDRVFPQSRRRRVARSSRPAVSASLWRARVRRCCRFATFQYP